MIKVITYGTFDLFHQGHYNILKRAKELGDYLIVGVTGDKYDQDRGKLNVKDSLVDRIKNVEATGFADEIIVEEYEGQKIRDVQKYDVDILVVGSDWIGKFDYLKKYCDVVYLERTKNISSTMLRESDNIIKVGLIEDTYYYNSVINESKYVSGIHIESVFSNDYDIAQKYGKKYELNVATDNFDMFLKDISVVWVQTLCTDSDDTYCQIEKAIKLGKHIVLNYSIFDSYEYINKLQLLAKENNVYIFEDVVFKYSRLFDQMLWRLKGGEIGDLLKIDVSASLYSIETFSLSELKYLISYLIKNIFENTDNITQITYNSVDLLKSYYFISNGCEFHVSIGNGCLVEDKIEILGSNGKMIIPDKWWQIKYFYIEHNDGTVNYYADNSDGTGYRYIFSYLTQLLGGNSNEGIDMNNSGILEIYYNLE